METQLLHRGRLLDHVQIVVRDLAAARAFYDAVFGVLGRSVEQGGDDWFCCDELCVSTASSEAAQGELTGRIHLAFQTSGREQVEKAYAAALAAGGKANGEPGLRPYHPSYYAAFVLDPDGNNIEFVFHGAAERSADSVEIRFEA